MSQVFNFSAGPAMLPEAVLRKVQENLLNFNGLGVSVMEISHRSPAFLAVAKETQDCLRTLLAIPDHYHILFLQGGARGQFAAVPQNLAKSEQSTHYLCSGYWSACAAQEAKRFTRVQQQALQQHNARGELFLRTPDPILNNPAYVHLCSNETIDGIRMTTLPQTQSPLVADMSSCLLSETIDICQYGLIYACAQKNIGPAGLTLVIIRDELLNRETQLMPDIFNYQCQAQAGSMYNTPSTFAWYVTLEVCRWILAQGGLSAMAADNEKKSAYLYDYLDQSNFYTNTIAKENRSRVNVPFHLPTPALEPAFLQQATQAGLLFLQGHRAVGGMRASLYNAMPFSGVQALVDFLEQFASKSKKHQ